MTMSHFKLFYSKGRDSLRIGKSFPNHDIVSHNQHRKYHHHHNMGKKKNNLPKLVGGGHSNVGNAGILKLLSDLLNFSDPIKVSGGLGRRRSRAVLGELEGRWALVCVWGI